jgi:hypothetical protein
MFPVSYGWASIAFLFMSAIYAYITDKRCRARDVVVFSIVIQIATATLAYNEQFPVLYLAALSSSMEAFFAYLIWHEYRYLLRKPYTALLMATSVITLLWGLDSWIETGLLYNETEPSAFTFICSILTVIQGVILIVGARGKNGRGRDRASLFIRFISYFDSSINKSHEK